MSEFAEAPSLEELAPDSFLKQLERLKRLYQEIGVALDVQGQITDEDRRTNRERDPVSYKEWEHWIYDEQEEDLDECQALRAEFFVVFLAAAIRGLLEETEGEIKAARNNSSRPRDSVSQRGKNKKDRSDLLGRYSRTFDDFAIDLASGPKWSRIEDVVNTRDAIMHPEGQRRPRYSDRQGGIQLASPEGFNTLLDDLRQFCEWLRREVRTYRAGAAR